VQILKDDINTKLTGVASSVIREKMVTLILSERFPSMENCNMFLSDGKVQRACVHQFRQNLRDMHNNVVP
jgi:hypothetical protein